jgi:3-hydroxy-9,10-secoandrosta-1,3,5(10)-triene-9,17-dione monooxygenase
MPTDFTFNEEAEAVLLQQAEGLRPRLLNEALSSQTRDRLAGETVRALGAAEMFRISAPRRVGGLCASTKTAALVSAALAKSDPSAAWIVSVTNSNSRVASLASGRITKELFSDGVPVVCAAASPTGSARRVEGGFLVSGRWPYSTCCYHAAWGIFAIGAKDASGRSVPAAEAYLRMADLKVEHTWAVSGLRATGSETVVATDVFVPAHRYNEFSEDAEEAGPDGTPEPTDFIATAPHGRVTLLSVVIGAAEAILDLVIAASKSRGIAFTTYGRQADSPALQAEVGHAAIVIDNARLLMLHTATAVDNAALSRRRMTFSEQTRNRAQTCHAVETVVHAVEKLMFVGGSSAFTEASGIERYWRDLNVAARHAMHLPNVGYEIYGRFLLDVEPTIAVHRGAI